MKQPTRTRGFSLIELLTVIAIIAILAAIIFPVMGIAKKKARENQCMTNLKQIAMAAQLFKQDNRRYPLTLGSEARLDNGTLWMNSPNSTPEQFESVKSDTALFAEYVKTIKGFHCPESGIVSSRDVAVCERPDGSQFATYAYNSYDGHVSNIGGYAAGSAKAYNGEARYMLNWAPTLGDVTANDMKHYPPSEPDSEKLQQEDYERQLKWRNPPGDTVVTWCSLHAGTDPKANVLVVFADGSSDTIPLGEAQACKWRMRPKKG